jgi:hypothetical protein
MLLKAFGERHGFTFSDKMIFVFSTYKFEIYGCYDVNAACIRSCKDQYGNPDPRFPKDYRSPWALIRHVFCTRKRKPVRGLSILSHTFVANGISLLELKDRGECRSCSIYLSILTFRSIVSGYHLAWFSGEHLSGNYEGYDPLPYGREYAGGMRPTRSMMPSLIIPPAAPAPVVPAVPALELPPVVPAAPALELPPVVPAAPPAILDGPQEPLSRSSCARKPRVRSLSRATQTGSDSAGGSLTLPARSSCLNCAKSRSVEKIVKPECPAAQSVGAPRKRLACKEKRVRALVVSPVPPVQPDQDMQLLYDACEGLGVAPPHQWGCN